MPGITPCVKTPKSNLLVEISSRFRQLENQQHWRLLFAEEIEKTILRIPRARTFLHSLGRLLPNCAIRDMSVRHPIADIRADIAGRSFGPRRDMARPFFWRRKHLLPSPTGCPMHRVEIQILSGSPIPAIRPYAIPTLMLRSTLPG